MAKECSDLICAIYDVIDCPSFPHHESTYQLHRVAKFLAVLENHYPENEISSQLRPLLLVARDGFSVTTMVISKGLKMIKPEKLAEQLGASTCKGISEVMQMIRPEKIAERIKASKPTRSSSISITMEMVGFVEALLVPIPIETMGCADFFLARLSKHGELSDLHNDVSKKLHHLQAFLRLTAERCLEHESMKDLFSHVEDVAYDTAALFLTTIDDSMDSGLSKLLEKMTPFRPDLQQIYRRALIGLWSSRSETKMNTKNMYDFVDGLIQDGRELQRDSLIITLSSVLSLIKSDPFPFVEVGFLQSHVEALVIEVALTIYSSHETTVMEHAHFIFELMFDHVKHEYSMFKYLNMKQLFNINPLEVLTDYFWGELILLERFFMNTLDQCKEQSKIPDILTIIKSLSRQVWSHIKYLSPSGEPDRFGRNPNFLHSQMRLKFDFTKPLIEAAIRQMSPDISLSSTLDRPMINLLHFLPIDFGAIDCFFDNLHLKVSPSSDCPKMEEILALFHDDILDKLQLTYEMNQSYLEVNEIKKLYHGLLFLATYLVDPLVTSIGRKKQNSLLIESALCSSYEDVLLFLSVTVKLLESEECLKYLLEHPPRAQILDLIRSAHEELLFLRAFLMDVLMQHTDSSELHDLLRHAEVTANKLSRISGSCNVMKFDFEKLRLALSDMLLEFESLKVEVRKVCYQLLDCNTTGGEDLISFLCYQLLDCYTIGGEDLISFLLNHRDFMRDCGASISFLKDQIPFIEEKLVYLGSFLTDIVQYRNMQQELKELWKRVQDIKYVCLFPFSGNRPAWYYMIYLCDFKQLLRFVEAEVEMICIKVPDSSCYSFPKTNGLGFLHCLLGKLEDLLCSKPDSIVGLEHQIVSVNEGFRCLRSLTDHFAESYDEEEAFGLITSVTEMAYKAEYVIDSCLTCSHPLWYKVLWISEVVENIKLVTNVVSETFERKKIDKAVHKVKKTSTYLTLSLSANSPKYYEEVEGFQEVMDHVKKQLVRGLPQLDVVSLVGMPGIGKTTIAEKIYNDPVVTSYFDIRAHCRVTQVYSWRGLLLTILNGVLEPSERNGKEDGELADELRRFLLTKRFLLLIDDVWDTEVWDNLHMCFSDSWKGSRIILTTRLSDVASYAQCESKPHHLRLLRDDESWSLLQREVFQEESCPPELEDVGFRIAKSCGGLPLFIVLVAGVLKEKKKKAELWKEIEESICSENIGSLEESMSMIGFSYKNLPHELKPCFLYLGGLLKGKNIHVTKLTRLWVAEGFVQANTKKGPEAVARGFLEDLIGRNLVMGVEKKPNGRLKTCRIHDLLHIFCLEMAKQENFFLRINRFSGEDAFPVKPKEYRLFVHSYEDQIDLWKPSWSNVRSLIFNVIDSDKLLWPRDLTFIFDSFKHVKVLDLESINIGGTFPGEVQSLIQLKFFAAQTGANSIPSSIAKLWNLETLVVRGLGVEVILPSSLLEMVKLRNIHVNHRASFSLHENMGESLSNSQLDSLETFSTPHLSFGEDTEMILRKMLKLRKLSCIFSGTSGYSEKVKGECVLFPRLEFLSRLESLNVTSNSYPSKLPHVFSFPASLRELTLSRFRLPWSQISTIGELPHLEILKLLVRAFEGDNWEVKDSEFAALKYLELDDLNFEQWSITGDAFPKLEHLVLTKCKQLEKIPSHFDDAVSLKSIEVKWCSCSVANSALEIQKIQCEEMANDSFTVTIQPLDWARK